MFKKIVVLFLISLILALPISAATEIKKPKITSEAYVLYNPKTDEIIESKKANQKMYPASLTKMLTALVCYELCVDLDDVITVSENAVKSIYGTGSSKANIQIGEEITIRQMIYLMLLPSGNDAANALAEHFCGDNKAFAIQMNKKAQELGMRDSNFVNPHGLHNAKHYTTAADLAILADAFIKVDFLNKVVGTVEYIMPKTNKQPERTIKTTNLMKVQGSGYYYPYVKGIKTGYTDDAGHCLVTNAKKGDEEYICVLLDCPEVWLKSGYIRSEFLEAASVFDYAFNTFEMVKIAQKDTKIGEKTVDETYGKKVYIILKDDVFATIPKGTDLSDLTFDYKLENLNEENFLIPPINANDKLGRAKLYLKGVYLGETDVLAGNSVKANAWLEFWHKIDFYVYLSASIIGGIIFLFIVLMIRKYIILNKRRREKQKRLERRKQMEAEFAAREPYDYFNIR